MDSLICYNLRAKQALSVTFRAEPSARPSCDFFKRDRHGTDVKP